EKLMEIVNTTAGADLTKDGRSQARPRGNGELKTAASWKSSPHPLEHRLIYKNIGRPDWTTDIDRYLRDGGYEQLKQALTLPREDIINKVKNSGLRGRGGAGFFCGL